MNPQIADFTEPLTAIRTRLRSGDNVAVTELRTALRAAHRAAHKMHGSSDINAGTVPTDRLCELVTPLVDEIISHPEGRFPHSGEAGLATQTGAEILAAFGMPTRKIAAQTAWWQTLGIYAKGGLPFAHHRHDASRQRREIDGARAIDAGVALLVEQQLDQALTCFEFAYNLTAGFVPTNTDIELNAWIGDLEPNEFPARLRFRRQLVIGTMTHLSEDRADDGLPFTAKLVAGQREVAFGELSAEEITSARETFRLYRADGFARHIRVRGLGD